MNMRNAKKIVVGILFAIFPFIAFSAVQPIASIVTAPGIPPSAKMLYCFDTSSAFRNGIMNQQPVVTIVGSNAAKTRDAISFVALTDSSGKQFSNNAAQGDNRELAIGKFSYTFKNFLITPEDLRNASCVLVGVMGYGGDEPKGMDTIHSVDLRYEAQSGETCGDPPPPVEEKPPLTFTDIRKQEQDRLAIAQAGRGGTVTASCSGTSSGPLSPGTMANDTSTGTSGWSSIDNAKVSDNASASVAAPGSSVTSNYLKATNFGFAVPTGATINGITVEVEKKQQNGTGVTDEKMRIVKGGTISSTNSTAVAWTSSDAYATYGSSTNLWGETWSASDINASTFGFAFSVNLPGNSVAALVDHIRITVYYTPLTCASVYDSFIDLFRAIFHALKNKLKSN